MNSKWNLKRVIAACAIVLLVGLYVATLIAAIFSAPGKGSLFRLCLIMTVVVPVLAYLVIHFLNRRP